MHRTWCHLCKKNLLTPTVMNIFNEAKRAKKMLLALDWSCNIFLIWSVYFPPITLLLISLQWHTWVCEGMFDVNSTRQNDIWKFIIGKSSLQEMVNFAIIQEISYLLHEINKCHLVRWKFFLDARMHSILTWHSKWIWRVGLWAYFCFPQI